MVWMLRAAEPDLRAASRDWVVQAGTCPPAVVVVVGLDSAELPVDPDELFRTWGQFLICRKFISPFLKIKIPSTIACCLPPILAILDPLCISGTSDVKICKLYPTIT